MGSWSNHTRFVLPLVLLPILAILTYGNSLHNDWQFDDWSSIVNNEVIRNLSNTAVFFTDPRAFKDNAGDFLHMFRPLLLVSYALTYAIGGLSLPIWHLTQIVLHIGCAILVFLVLKEVTESDIAAFFAAAFFTVHPLQSQAVNYLSSRSELQSSFFYLLSLLLFIYYYSSQGWKRHILYGLSLVSLAAALLTKSIAVTLPAVLVVWLWFTDGNRKLSNYLVTVPHFLVTAGYVVFRHLVITWTASQISAGSQIIHSDYYTTNSRPFWDNLLIQGEVFWRYLCLFFKWDQISAIHHIGDASMITYVASLSLVILLSVLFCLRNEDKRLAFCALFYLVLIAPTSIIPLNLPMNEHRIYLASAGVFGIISHMVIRRLSSAKESQHRYALACACLLLCCCISYTRARNTYWQSPIKLWQDALQKAPLSRYGHAQYAVALFRNNHFEEGVWEMELANRIYGKMSKTLSVTAATYHNKLGNIHLAKHYIENALQKNGSDPDTILAAAQVSERFHQPEKTREHLTKLLELEPGNAVGRAIMANFSKACKELDRNIKRLKEEIKAKGEKKELLMELALALDKGGHFLEVEEITNKLIKEKVLEALILKGNSLLRQERYEEAIQVFNRLVHIPGTPNDCVQKLVIALAGAGLKKEANQLGSKLSQRGLPLSLDTRFAAQLPPYSGFPVSMAHCVNEKELTD